MKHILNKIIRNVKSVKGNSLAEFATTTALMATLATTAAPKLSEMSEGAKGEKSRNEIDKIIKQAGQFYQDTADLEGRGRFPNQVKFDESIGGPNGNYANRDGADNSRYNDSIASDAHLKAVLDDLALDAAGLADKEEGWDRFDEEHANVWQSVFGLQVQMRKVFNQPMYLEQMPMVMNMLQVFKMLQLVMLMSGIHFLAMKSWKANFKMVITSTL